jgi:hypothetical protein
MIRMLLPLLVTVQFIVLHVADGYEVAVNPAHVSTLREAAHSSRFLALGIHCVVGLSSAKFLAVRESCQDVQRLLEAR